MNLNRAITRIRPPTLQSSDSDISPLYGKQKFDKKKYCFKIKQKKKRGLEEFLKRDKIQRKELQNSDLLFFNEFIHIYKRREYTATIVDKYFKRLTQIDNKKQCHVCGDTLSFFKTKVMKRCFCYFCLEYVCDKKCLSDETFIIPRNFNIDFDLRKRPVCESAAMLLNRNNYLKIEYMHPQVRLQEPLFNFMVHRRRVHKMYDMIKCEE